MISLHRIRRFGRVLRASVSPPFRSMTVAMLHLGRCGSTVLANQIGQHVDIWWDGEIYEEMFRGRIPETALVRDPFRLLRLRRLYAGARAYGIEVKFHPRYHLNTPVLDMTPGECYRALREAGVTHFIVLERTNYLRQQISEEVGRQENRWHRKREEAASLHQIELDPDRVRFGGARISLLDSFQERDENYARIRELVCDAPSLWLTYEDDIRDDPRVGYRKAADFLGFSPINTHIQKGRTNPFPVADMLRNYDAVASHLRGTSYEWMLDD